MAMMEISVIPLGTPKTSISPYVAAVYRKLRSQKTLSYELNPMGTVVRGPAERLLRLAAELHRIPFAKGAKRVYTVIKLDDRRDKDTDMVGKVASVMEKL